MRIIVELKRGSQPRQVLNQLLKYSPLQSTFGVQLLALVDGEPRLLSLKRALTIYIEHRREVVTRRVRYDLRKAQERAHILEGLRIALANLDAVIALIRGSRDAEEARQGLMHRFHLTEAQAQAILDMPLRRLAALERQKIEEEYQELQRQIAYYEDLLANPAKILGVIRQELLDLKAQYGDARRTHIVAEEGEELAEEDLVPQEHVVVTLTQRGYVKRAPARTFRPQSRGGKGVIGITTREEDAVEQLIAANTHDTLLFFTDRGRVFQERVFQIPDASRQSRGIPLVNIINLDQGERVTALVPIPNGANGDGNAGQFMLMVTAQGRIKRVELSEFLSIRPSGIIALTLEDGDALGWVRLTDGRREIILVTREGKALRFPEEQVRPMGRTARGVTAMRLADGDEIAGVEVVEPGADLLVLTGAGYGKRTPLDEFPVHSRGAGGVIALKDAAKYGGIAAVRVVRPEDDIIISSQEGQVLRLSVRDVPRQGRSARGVRLIQLRGEDRAAALARIPAEDRPAEAP